jgi:hypothetical protein
MAFEHSTRRKRLPKNWPTIRANVLRRCRRRCEHIDDETGERCTALATEVDHREAGDDHSYANLQGLCSWHHARKTSAEGHRAQGPKAKLRRPSEPHPGLRE